MEWVTLLHHTTGHSGDWSGWAAAAAVTTAHQRIGEEIDECLSRMSMSISYWRAKEALMDEEEQLLEDDELELDEGGSASDST